MDEKAFELAAAVTGALTENGIDKIRAQVRKRDPNFDGYCEDCADPIPEARLDTGATTCLECQQVRERVAAQYRP